MLCLIETRPSSKSSNRDEQRKFLLYQIHSVYVVLGEITDAQPVVSAADAGMRLPLARQDFHCTSMFSDTFFSINSRVRMRKWNMSPC